MSAAALPQADSPALSMNFWWAQILGWLILSVVGFSTRLAVFGNVGHLAFWLTLAMEPVAFILTSIFAIVHQHLGGATRWSVVSLASVIVFAVTGALVQVMVARGVMQFVDASLLRPIAMQQYRLGFIYYTGIFSIWTLVYLGVKTELAVQKNHLAATRAQTYALRLELEHLRAQIEPHFMFNCLNTIVAEVAERLDVAEEMTRRLAEYLRYSLDQHGSGLCTVADDIKAAEAYVRIQALRFEALLDLAMRVEPEALNRHVPQMLLQGLVENALKHGWKDTDEPLVITVDIHCRGIELNIAVRNRGRLQPPPEECRRVGGIDTLRRQIELRYPQGYSFSLCQHGVMTVAQLCLRGDPKLL